MAFADFDATAALLATDYLGHYGAFSATSTPTETAVGRIIARKAGRISGLLESIGIDPSAIDSVGEPISYQNMQDLVLFGAASQVARLWTGSNITGEITDAWSAEWKSGLAALKDRATAKELLSDIISDDDAGFMRTHIQAGSETPTGAGDIEVDDPVFTQDMSL